MENQIVNPYARKRKVESSKAPGDLVERSQKGTLDEQKNGPKIISLSWNAAASKKSKDNKNKTLQMSQPEPSYNLPMSAEYARALIKHKSFPYIDSNDQVYLYAIDGGGSIGSKIQKKDNRQYLQHRELTEHIEHYFPNDHIHTVMPPFQCAIKFKSDMAQRTLTGSVLQWTRDSVKKAARKFELTGDTKKYTFLAGLAPEANSTERSKLRYRNWRCAHPMSSMLL
jgi:hypothetical protein